MLLKQKYNKIKQNKPKQNSNIPLGHMVNTLMFTGSENSPYRTFKLLAELIWSQEFLQISKNI